jgi:membrane-associated phospholipid phosphatase
MFPGNSRFWYKEPEKCVLIKLKAAGISNFLGRMYLGLSVFFLVSEIASGQGEVRMFASTDSSKAKLSSVYSAGDSVASAGIDRSQLRWYDMFARIPTDWARYSEETFRVDHLSAIAGMAILTAGLVATDYETWQIEKKWYDESPVFRTISDMFVFTGDGKFQFGIVGIFAAQGFIFKDARALRTASQTTEAILACGGVVQLLKHITGRESPFVSTKRTGAWRFFPNQLDYLKHVPNYDAFPSGHIATAMTTLIVISENYPEVKWLKPAGFIALGVISSSLVATGIHWWSDIPLGLALGYSFGELAANPAGVRIGGSATGGNIRLSMTPVILPAGAGAGVTLSF